MKEIFRWKNCYADIVAHGHPSTVRSYLKEVVQPAIVALRAKITDLQNDEDELAVFGLDNVEHLLSETKKGFVLSIQSIWERQFRLYLAGCAQYLQPDATLLGRIEKGTWKTLQGHFNDLRGISLEQFPSFRDLDTLMELGSACRHGDGRAATIIGEQHPEWWPSYETPLSIFPINPAPKRIGQMVIPETYLATATEAVANFWVDVEYIYNESIETKHPSLETKLQRERAERKWIPYLRSESP